MKRFQESTKCKILGDGAYPQTSWMTNTYANNIYA